MKRSSGGSVAIPTGIACNAIWLFASQTPDSDQDFVYGISHINVSSPEPGVATQFSSKTTKSQGGREEEFERQDRRSEPDYLRRYRDLCLLWRNWPPWP
jgi:hypothetical protein